MSYIVPNIPRSNLGLAHDMRGYLETLRRRDIWLKLQEAKVSFTGQETKDELIRMAVKHCVNLEKTPASTERLTAPEYSIHELRKQVLGLSKDDGKWEWDEVKKLSKDQLKAILNGDNTATGS